MNPIQAAAKKLALANANTSMGAIDGKSVKPGQFLLPGQDGHPQRNEWTVERAVKDGYVAAPTLYACIDRIMKAVISVRWYTARHDESDDTDDEEIPNHPMTQLIYNPNPNMSRERMFQYLVQHKYLGGNALWSKIRINVGGRPVPVELWPLPPDKVHPIPDRRNFLAGYKIDKSIAVPGREEVPARDIIHWQFANPHDPYWGIAPLMALAMTVDADIEAMRTHLHSMENRARSSGVLSFDNPLTEDQWEAAREKMRMQHQGSDKAGNIMVMPHGVSFTPWTMSATEMDFIESRKFGREDICAVHGLMPPAVGYMEDATLANVEVADRAVWRNAAIPLLKMIRTEFNRSLAPEFGPGVYLTFDTSDIEVLQEDLDKQTQIAERLFRMGVPFNEINHRLKLGINDIPGGEAGYLPINLIPADVDHPSISQVRPLSSGDNGTEDEREMREFAEYKSIMKMLNSGNGAKDNT